MKEVTHIDCPKEWQSTNDWDSHKPLLYISLNRTKGVIIEMGSGKGSTPFIRQYADKTYRLFKSFETDRQWAYNVGAKYIRSYDGLIFDDNISISLLFVDFAPGDKRKDLIANYADVAGCIVVHDTESGAEYVYGMASVLSTFKYRLDYRPEGKPHTTVVSNFVNVEEWV